MLGIWIARRLDRGYVAALERSLRDRAVELKIEDVQDNTTRATLIRAIADFQRVSELADDPEMLKAARDATDAASKQK